MIGATFSLSLLMIFMLAVMVTDFLGFVAETRRGVEEAFSKDNSIFKDYEPDS
jgi:hypothetical protein